MTSASHGFKTLRDHGIASKGDRRESLGSARGPRVLAIASSRSRTFSPTLLEPEPDGFGAPPKLAREPRALPRNDADQLRERPLIGRCDHSKINFFQSLRLLLQVKFSSHYLGSRGRDARKQTGILCSVEQCSR
jgi:hypothetical protein